MSINIPTSASEISKRVKVDISRELPGSNPFLKNSWIGALSTAFANRVYDFYYALRRAQLETIPDTATLNLEQWAAIWDILRIPASMSSGKIAVSGTAASAIPLGTIFVSRDGIRFSSTAAVVIANQVLSVSSITRSGTVATLTTVNDHLLGSNILITIAGAAQTQYNLSAVSCIVTGAKTLQYTVSGSPATPATGTITLSFTSVSVPVQSLEEGSDNNIVADTSVTLQSPLAGVNNSNNVDSGAIGGGSDQESDVSLRNRLIERIQNPIAHFNVSEIIAVSKSVAGVTRVFVFPITPDVGQVTIYFMRDNDVDPIPDASEVLAVKTAILEITPANTDPVDVIVTAPTPVTVNFTFTALSPDTSTMRDAVSNSLQQFFAERADVGVNVVEEAYNAAIFNTVDIETGSEIESFTLSAPTGDITIATGQIGKLGNVTFP